jgi:hypothetical protein
MYIAVTITVLSFIAPLDSRQCGRIRLLFVPPFPFYVASIVLLPPSRRESAWWAAILFFISTIIHMGRFTSMSHYDERR